MGELGKKKGSRDERHLSHEMQRTSKKELADEAMLDG